MSRVSLLNSKIVAEMSTVATVSISQETLGSEDESNEKLGGADEGSEDEMADLFGDDEKPGGAAS